MRLSGLINVHSMQPKDGWLKLSGAEIAMRSGLVSFVDAGFPCFSPFAQMLLTRFEDFLRRECHKHGFWEIKVPVVHREAHLEAASISDAYKDQFFRLSDPLRGFMLSATSEEYFLKHIHMFGAISYRQLPIRVFQFQDAFRFVKRCEGVYKSRSFYGCVFTSLDNNISSYLASLNCFSQIVEVVMNAFGIPFIVLRSTSNDAIEYLSPCPEGDRSIADSIAVKQEELEKSSLGSRNGFEEKYASLAMGYEYKSVAHYGVTVETQGSGTITPIMGTFGIGLQRCLCAVLQHNRDNKGLSFPPTVRPWNVLITQAGAETNASVLFTQKAYKRLIDGNVAIVWDDRHGKTLKEKMQFADFWGIPVRVVIGPKEVSSQTVELRFREKAKGIKNTELDSLVEVITNANS